MTEKEFENLKVGDKVWIITDWFNKSNEGMKAVQIEVAGKDDKGIVQFVGGGFNSTHCYLTKSEAWEHEVKCGEGSLKAREQELEKDRKTLDRYKAELAKAKEEEVVWTVDFEKGSVVRSTKRRWEGSAENYEWSLGSPRYKPCDTEREAYEALAEYYKGKYEEALVTSGKARFVIRCGDKICLVQDVETAEGNMVWVSDCDGFSLYVPKENVFSTRQEAEAELERRKND